MRPIVSEVQGSASAGIGDPPARAERGCSDDAGSVSRAVCNYAEDGAGREVRAAQAASVPAAAESGPRTMESIRAESAHRNLHATHRKLAKARTEFVRRFDALMFDHFLRGEEAYSNVAIARAVGVDEKTVRQWRSGEKQLRAETVSLFPGRLRDEVLAILKDLAGRTPERALVQLGRSLDALDSQVTQESPTDLVPALDHAIGRIVDLKRKAMGGR